jgi:hypothetical protein
MLVSPASADAVFCFHTWLFRQLPHVPLRSRRGISSRLSPTSAASGERAAGAWLVCSPQCTSAACDPLKRSVWRRLTSPSRGAAGALLCSTELALQSASSGRRRGRPMMTAASRTGPTRRSTRSHSASARYSAEKGAVAPSSTYYRVWQEARFLAWPPAAAISPLAGRPYDLRHSALSTWLGGAVSPAAMPQDPVHSSSTGPGTRPLRAAYGCTNTKTPASAFPLVTGSLGTS